MELDSPSIRVFIGFFFGIICSLIILIIFAAPGNGQEPSRKLLVGTEYGFYPFADVDEKGRPQGFSVDLIQAVARKMEFELEFQTGTWKQILTAIENRQIDALPLVKHTERRDRFLDFTIIHTMEYAIIVKRDGSKSIESLKDLKGKKVTVMDADGTHLYIAEHVPEALLIKTPTVGEGLQLLAEGSCDYAVVARSVGLVKIRDMNLQILQPTGPLLEAFSKGFSFGVQDGDRETLAILNQGLNLVRQSGEYDQIYNRWFGDIDPRSAAEALKRRIFIGIIGVILTGLIVTIWIVVLRKLVALRTTELAEEIEEHKKAREQLIKAELKYRTVADFTYDWEYWSNNDGSLEYVSPSSERISGYSPQDFLSNPSLFQQIIVSEDRDIWDTHYCDDRTEIKTREIIFRIQRKDGEIRWIEHACQPVADTQRGNMGFRASNRDITERKQVELNLKRSYSENERLKKQLEAEGSYLREEIKAEYDFESIIGKSDAINYVFYKIEQVSEQDTTVLIQGETGTGKELVARAIHSLSPRSNRPIVKINCAALPADLIESEMFGHEKGSFTGAHVKQIGRFELADGATLFLDEIGELPLELQAKLLRVLEDGEFERIGSAHTLKVDIRIIAATNRDLETEVQKGRFRSDLWYRLKVFPITVPLLRERRDDISLLVNSFLGIFNKKMGKNVETISEDTMQVLRNYSWPGNVRELKNVIERAVINSSGPKLRLAENLKTLHKDMPASLRPLKEIERDYIIDVLKETDWRIDGPKGAALILGLNPSTLRSRMQKLAIQKP